MKYTYKKKKNSLSKAKTTMEKSTTSLRKKIKKVDQNSYPYYYAQCE
jgi:prefoldin subunit 5